MKATRLLVGAVVAAVMFSMSVSSASAQVAQTIVTGVVTDGSNNPVTGGSVQVQCGTGSQSGSINSGGSYQVVFEQTACKAGDTATVTATTPQGSGSGSTTVQDSVTTPVVDIDIAVVAISVPEFGIIGGMISMIGAVGSYIYMKSKAAV